MKRFSRRHLATIVLLSLVVIITGTGAAVPSSAQVTKGEVHTFAAGLAGVMISPGVPKWSVLPTAGP